MINDVKRFKDKDKTGHDRTRQDKTRNRQDKTKQNKAKQDKARSKAITILEKTQAEKGRHVIQKADKEADTHRTKAR
jgi:hypothetical protein